MVLEEKIALIIDVNAIVYRMSSVKNLNPQIQEIGGAWSSLRSMLKIWRVYGATHCFAALDSQTNKRKKLAATYKSNRKPIEENIKQQMRLFMQLLDIVQVQHFQELGYEADDVIASLAEQLQDFSKIYIFTTDKDLLQLINEKTQVIKMQNGGSVLYDEDKFRATMGFSPNQWPDFIGLAGDSCDFIPGIRGIGPKFALTLLQQFECLENVLKNHHLLPRKKSEMIEKHTDIAIQSKILATAYKDLSLSINHKPFCLQQQMLPKLSELLGSEPAKMLF